jgi:hypothetical protein
MRCFGEFKNDRTCDLCMLADNKSYIPCKEKYDKEKKLCEKLWNIKINCPNRVSGYDDYEKYYRCTLKLGRHDECDCTLDCKKYLKEVTK